MTGKNFLSWRRSMTIALGAKRKLGFINGDIVQPDIDDDDYDEWKKVDWMILSWILNTLSKDIAESFVYAETSKDLWDEICLRYGENNGPMRYKLQREINTLTQGHNSVMEYFNKLKKLWDEFACVVLVQMCNCPKGQMAVRHEAETKLIQFLMGLNDSYDHLKNQILLFDPLPSVNKAYSMVLSAERQRSVTNSLDRMENMAMNVKYEGYGRGQVGQGRGYGGRGGNWQGGRGRGSVRLSKEEKAKLLCDKC
ncbi:Unknown protein, partial [Striga hermonthica]